MDEQELKKAIDKELGLYPEQLKLDPEYFFYLASEYADAKASKARLEVLNNLLYQLEKERYGSEMAIHMDTNSHFVSAKQGEKRGFSRTIMMIKVAISFIEQENLPNLKHETPIQEG